MTGIHCSAASLEAAQPTHLLSLPASLHPLPLLAHLHLRTLRLQNTCPQIGDGLPIAVSLVAVAMGLNLLEVLPLRLPSLDVDVRGLGVPPAAQAYLAGERGGWGVQEDAWQQLLLRFACNSAG